MFTASSLARRARYSLLIAISICAGVCATAGDELYRFSGKNQNPEPPPATSPQLQFQQEDNGARQQAGQAAQDTPSSVINDRGSPPGIDQESDGPKEPLPGGGPKMGVGPVGPGGTSRAAHDPDSGPNRYANRPPSWENLNETDSGRNKNAPGEGNTSVASGANIFGTSPVPFSAGPGKL